MPLRNAQDIRLNMFQTKLSVDEVACSPALNQEIVQLHRDSITWLKQHSMVSPRGKIVVHNSYVLAQVCDAIKLGQ